MPNSILKHIIFNPPGSIPSSLGVNETMILWDLAIYRVVHDLVTTAWIFRLSACVESNFSIIHLNNILKIQMIHLTYRNRCPLHQSPLERIQRYCHEVEESFL